MMTLVVVIVVAIVVVAAGVAISQRLGRAPAGVRVRQVLPTHPEPVAVADPPPQPEEEEDPAPVVAAPAITWTAQLNSTPLDDTARERLIDDLAMLRAAWCVPLLAKAYDEEVLASHRRRALVALANCEQAETARATFERALSSEDDDERAIAHDTLARFDGARTA
jgi:hypothetical protein